MVDLSVKGGKVACGQKVEIGTHMNLRIALPDDVSPLQVELAEVRWAIGKYMGLEFLVVEDKQQARLLKFVNALEGQDKLVRPKCPQCGKDFVKRVARKGVGELLVGLSYLYPFRCQLCARRFKAVQWGRRYVSQLIDRREYQRVRASFSATFLGDGIEGAGSITDVSLRCGSLKTDAHLGKDTLLQVQFQVPRSESPVVVEVAIVRSIRPGFVGLEFLRFAPESEIRLSSSVYDQLVSYLYY